MSKDRGYKEERAWIYKKINSGVNQKELRESIRIFSNKTKKKVMENKHLSEKKYKTRKEFLENVYKLLRKEKFERKKPHKAFQSREYPKGYWNHYDNVEEIEW